MDSFAGGEDGASVHVMPPGGGEEVLFADNISEGTGGDDVTRSEQNCGEGEGEEDEDEEENSTTYYEDSYFTPTGRPIAEPPMFDYDKFIDEKVPSKKRLAILVPERRDIDKRMTFGDTKTELHLLQMYMNWVRDMALKS